MTIELHPRLAAEIRETATKLLASGGMMSRERLLQYYAAFRARFGPAALSKLDGEELLNTVHDHGDQESLVYWLEFKNDEELPTKVFGSIAGGSALKLGIYRRRETGLWMAGSSKNQRVLTTEEAIEQARVHRDELVRGAEILDAASDDPDRVDYVALHTAITQAAPSVCERAWGHKYLAMMAPTILDHYHATYYQAYHLCRLLIEPPAGRYECAGPLTQVAKQLNLLPVQLGTVLNELHGDPRRWMCAGNAGGDEAQWASMRSGGYVAVGPNRLGSLVELTHDEESKTALKARLAADTPDATPQAIAQSASQLLDFVAKSRVGDVVVAMNEATVVGLGVVEGDYEYVPVPGERHHRRRVTWFDTARWTLPQAKRLRSMWRQLKLSANLVAIERRRVEANAADQAKPPIPSGAGPLPLDPMVDRIDRARKRKGQVILFGPPGTGKTHYAELATRELAARSHFGGRRWAELSAPEQASLSDDSEAGLGAIVTCCFHPAYGYEDFIEGFRPKSTGASLGFDLRPGVFKRVCARAAKHPARDYFLLIDEINRGDVPRIFGELLTVLEKSRRGQPITLPVSGEQLRVPANVFVVATMNTADRSIALLDAALRRRFAFVELMPEPKRLHGASVGGLPLEPWLDTLNRRIVQHLGRDARNLQVGHAYLLERGQPISEMPKFREVLRDEIVPLIEEYCYDQPDALAQIVGTQLYDTRHGRLVEELFAPGRESELVAALSDPTVATSAAAMGLGDEDEGAEDADDTDDDEEASATA